MRPTTRALLVGVQLPGISDEEHASSLAELARLGETLGLEIVAKISQKRSALSKAAVVGRGKLKELARYGGGPGEVPSPAKAQKRGWKKDEDEDDEDEDEDASPPEGEAQQVKLILVDHDLSPSQARNLERAVGTEVMDRTSVILAIFHRHARSREARLEVEIARLAYSVPRLREAGAGSDRQRGGIGGRGAGESSLELDRRRVRDRIAELRHELDAIKATAGTRRRRRAELSTAALVGYTNAGKSSLMRGLTGSEVLVADALFATLDTTVRALHPETRPRILITDTVGFIKHLPHALVASFRSTLEEAAEADLLLQVVDASDPAFPAQIAVTEEVLREIGAESPRLLLLNKRDRLSAEQRAALERDYPEAILISARDLGDVARLRERIRDYFERELVDAELAIPFAEQSRVAEIHRLCRVIVEEYDENGAHLKIRGRPEVIDRLLPKEGKPGTSVQAK